MEKKMEKKRAILVTSSTLLPKPQPTNTTVKNGKDRLAQKIKEIEKWAKLEEKAKREIRREKRKAKAERNQKKKDYKVDEHFGTKQVAITKFFKPK